MEIIPKDENSGPVALAREPNDRRVPMTAPF